ncbi:hypothetical protein Tsubulata_045747 [Turnera subulata]|uniref:Uncharacterized protein n=1 Tax=Turnera subulata TaxID=218843 RepID=A0A9Q0GEZ6_9ROSI|nr:hypothetical protein Tsubulata_045747 [Turnera subulata]
MHFSFGLEIPISLFSPSIIVSVFSSHSQTCPSPLSHNRPIDHATLPLPALLLPFLLSLSQRNLVFGICIFLKGRGRKRQYTERDGEEMLRFEVGGKVVERVDLLRKKHWAWRFDVWPFVHKRIAQPLVKKSDETFYTMRTKLKGGQVISYGLDDFGFLF